MLLEVFVDGFRTNARALRFILGTGSWAEVTRGIEVLAERPRFAKSGFSDMLVGKAASMNEECRACCLLLYEVMYVRRQLYFIFKKNVLGNSMSPKTALVRNRKG